MKIIDEIGYSPENMEEKIEEMDKSNQEYIFYGNPGETHYIGTVDSKKKNLDLSAIDEDVEIVVPSKITGRSDSWGVMDENVLFIRMKLDEGRRTLARDCITSVLPTSGNDEESNQGNDVVIDGGKIAAISVTQSDNKMYYSMFVTFEIPDSKYFKVLNPEDDKYEDRDVDETSRASSINKSSLELTMNSFMEKFIEEVRGEVE
jgi:lipoate-protein ligase A